MEIKNFKSWLKEESFEIGKFIESVKKQLSAFKKSDNKEGVDFLQGILDSYKKNGSLSPDQVKAASKFMN